MVFPMPVIVAAADLEFVQRLRDNHPQTGLAGLPAWSNLDGWATDIARIPATLPAAGPVPPLH